MRRFNYCWFFLLLVISAWAGASELTYYTAGTSATKYSSKESAVSAICGFPICDSDTVVSSTRWSVYGYWYYGGASTYVGYVTKGTTSCAYGDNGTACNVTCDLPNVMEGGQCVAPVVPEECVQDWSGGEKVWSASKGSCVKYPNLAPSEFCGFMGGKSTNGVNSTLNSNSSDGPEQYVDNASKCSVAADQSSAECTSRVRPDATGSYTCKVVGQYTGQYDPNGTNMPDGYCPSGDCTEPPVPTDVPTPRPNEINDHKPCVYSAVTGGQACTSSTTNEKEGTSQCGTVNGSWQCINKAPTNNGIDIRTTVQTTQNPDGSTTTTKTDNATSTKCTGIGQCTSSSTTSTTTTSKDGSGNTTSVSGSCTGTDCPDKNTNPDGDGDGLGDCIGGDCAEGEGGAGDWYEPGEDTYASVIGDFSTAVSALPAVQGVDNFLTFTPSGNCPSYSVDAWVFHIQLDQWCSGSTIPWDLIRAIIIGCAAFLAFRIAFL